MKNSSKFLITSILILIILVISIPILTLKHNTISDYGIKSSKYKEGSMIILIGIDGATWDLMMPWISEGKLPNIGKLIEGGAYGNLTSSTPPYSPVAWTSIGTGMLEYKHNAHDYIYFINGEQELADRSMVNSKFVWEILSEHGMRVAVLNWLFTWPPTESINGFVVSGWTSKSREQTYPPSLSTTLESITSNITQSEIKRKYLERGVLESDLFYLWYDDFVAESNIVASHYLMEKNDLNFLAVAFFGSDHLQHRFWSYMQPQYFDVKKQKVDVLGGVILEYYIKVDDFIGDLIKKNPDATFIIFSDHGFGRNDLTAGEVIIENLYPNKLDPHFVFLHNLLLEELGLLSFDIPYDIQYLRDNFGCYWLLENIYRRCVSSTIDFTKTKAYFCNNLETGNTGVCVNLVGREANGIVPEGEYPKLRKQIIESFEGIKFYGTDERIFSEVYANPNAPSETPDVIVKLDPVFSKENIVFSDQNLFDHLEDGEKIIDKIIIENQVYPLKKFLSVSTTGDHKMEGVVILNGKNIKEGYVIQNASLLDITPTVLYLMGVPIGLDMDGKVLLDAMNSEYLKQNPIKYTRSHNDFYVYDGEEEGDGITLMGNRFYAHISTKDDIDTYCFDVKNKSSTITITLLESSYNPFDESVQFWDDPDLNKPCVGDNWGCLKVNGNVVDHLPYEFNFSDISDEKSSEEGFVHTYADDTLLCFYANKLALKKQDTRLGNTVEVGGYVSGILVSDVSKFEVNENLTHQIIERLERLGYLA